MFWFKNERIFLKEDAPDVYLDVYAIDDKRLKPRDAMLVIPGGGYSHVCVDREGEKTALAYAARGINSFVLNYSVGENAVFPVQLECAALAMAWIKDNAERYNVNPDRVFAVGFSAGGHLCGTLATMYNFIEQRLGLSKDYVRPHGIVMAYPVVSAFRPTHEGSFKNLLKKPFDALTDEERLVHSIEMNVNAQTPPAFLWHTASDPGVPVQGTLKLAIAYANAKVPFTVRIYPYGPHGIALGTEYSHTGNIDMIQPIAAKWIEESIEWMATV